MMREWGGGRRRQRGGVRRREFGLGRSALVGLWSLATVQLYCTLGCRTVVQIERGLNSVSFATWLVLPYFFLVFRRLLIKLAVVIQPVNANDQDYASISRHLQCYHHLQI
jgi:hypothetical protein